MVPLDWVFIYDLLSLFSGIVLGVVLMSSHHRLHLEMDDQE
jgi:hypothetical protein